MAAVDTTTFFPGGPDWEHFFAGLEKSVPNPSSNRALPALRGGSPHCLGPSVQLLSSQCFTAEASVYSRAVMLDHSSSTPAWHVQWPHTTVPSFFKDIHGSSWVSDRDWLLNLKLQKVAWPFFKMAATFLEQFFFFYCKQLNVQISKANRTLLQNSNKNRLHIEEMKHCPKKIKIANRQKIKNWK